MRTPRARRILRFLIGLCAALIVAALAVYADVQSAGHPIYTRASQAPAMPVAVVFGAQSVVMADRVQTAVDLYKAGKVQKLLLTGDNHTDGYDEPAQMRAQALAAGVPSQDLVVDDAGFRTYDSVYRARAIFGVRRAIFVTQRYHLPRALYLGRCLGLHVVGMDAARRRYGDQFWFDLREIGATEAAWLDVHLHRRPKFLGPKEPIVPG